MLLRLKKTRDGAVMSLVRDDGSILVQHSGQSAFFAAHDLMHAAVETTLGFRQGFLSLVASGWPLEAFTDHTHSLYRSLPAEAMLVEHLVDVFTRAYRDQAWRDDELFGCWCEDVDREVDRLAGRPVHVPHANKLAVCRAYSGHMARWATTPEGQHFELRLDWAPPDPPGP